MNNKGLVCIALSVIIVLLSFSAFAEEEAAVPVVFEDALSEHFLADGEAPVITDMSYLSENLSIEISVTRENRSDVYIADIWVRDLSLLRRGFGGGRWHSKMQKIATIAKQENAIIALTGDNGHNFDKGVVFANGKLLRKKENRKRDVCVIMTDGRMEIIKGSELTADRVKELDGQVWQSFLFGPNLFDDEGHARTKFTDGIGPANPRSVIGYYEPGHYCLIQIDGRGTKSIQGGKNVGMTLKQLAAYMESLGCKAAYNLDGGQSALMWFNGKVISHPYNGGRTVGDIVYLTDKTAAD